MMRVGLLVAICALAFATVAVGDKYIRYCYYTNWSQYRPGLGQFFPENIDPFLCTHIAYSFIEIGTNNQLKLREWNGDVLIASLVTLKQANPDLVLIAAVGGWNFGTARFTAICESEAIMNSFARTSVDFLRNYGFDGLDIDWEYPAARGSPPEDKDRFITLIQIIKSQFEDEAMRTNNKQLVLGAAVAAGNDKIDAGFHIEEACNILDIVSVMTYDYHGGSFENTTAHNSPLLGNTAGWGARYYYQEASIDIWLNGGCPAEKMLLGIPTYGRTYRLDNPDTDYGYNASASKGAGNPGVYTREAGFLAYYEICGLISSGRSVWDDEVMAPALVSGNNWISYDDVTSVGVKAQYAKDRGLGGVMVWSIDDDDFQSVCGVRNPLIRQIYLTLEGEESPACHISPTTTAVTWWPNPDATNPPVEIDCWYPLSPDETTPSIPDTSGTTKQTETTTTEEPPPPCTGDNCPICTGSGLVPDPEDCQCYYQCSNKINLGRMCCAEGLIFNADDGFCDWPYNYDCGGETTTTIGPPPPQSTTTGPPPPQSTTTVPASTTTNASGFTCVGKADGNYADPVDCHVFHQCYQEIDHVFECAQGLVFDPVAGICNWPSENIKC